MLNSISQYIETKHGVIDYLVIGEGIAVLYFHGTGAGNDAALLLEQPLIQSGCRLIIPNRPGYGETTSGPAGSASFCANLAAELLDHLSVERVAVIGTSGGGMPAANFARIHPDRVTGLILQCAQSHRWTSGQWLPHGLGRVRFLFQLRLFTPLLRWQNMRVAKAGHRDPISCLRQMSGNRFPELREDPDTLLQITELTEMTLRCAATPAGIQNDWAILTSDNGLSPGVIDCPALIIHDRADPLVPFEHANWSYSCLPRSKLLEIHAGGHLIWFGRDSEIMHNHRMAFLRDGCNEERIQE